MVRAPQSSRRRSSARASDDALVLRRFPFGESSLVVQILTPHHGRLSLIAKGAFRPRSAYCGVLDLFDGLELGWRTSKSSEVGVLTTGELRIRRRGITADLARYHRALSVLELAGIGGREGEGDPELYELTSRSLDLLHEGRADPAVVLIAHDLRFLACMGLAPALVRCAACGKDVADPGRGRRRPKSAALTVPFCPGAGGRLCGGCAEEATGRGRNLESVTPGALHVADRLLAAEPAPLGRIVIEPRLRDEVRGFTERFLEYHLEVRPRTRRGRGKRTSRPRRTP